MIGTCTLNPSLDYYLEFEKEIELGKTNRSNLEYYEAGGKGVNVSIVLNNLHIPSRAFGFLGGFTKDFYISLLQKYEQIRPSFVYIDGMTRINVKAHAPTHTNYNAAGPYITHDDMKSLAEKVSSLYEGDYFVLAGSTPSYLENEVVDILCREAEEGVKLVLDDCDSMIVEKSLSFKPFLVKFNLEEYQEKVGHSVSRDELVAHGQSLLAKGACHVIILESKKNALYISEEGSFKAPLSDGEQRVNTVGVGDSIVAGFLMNYQRSYDGMESFRFAAGCGSATAYSKSLATMERINQQFESIEVTRLEDEKE